MISWRGWSNLEYSSSIDVLLILLFLVTVNVDCLSGWPPVDPFVALGVEAVAIAFFLW